MTKSEKDYIVTKVQESDVELQKTTLVYALKNFPFGIGYEKYKALRYLTFDQKLQLALHQYLILKEMADNLGVIVPTLTESIDYQKKLYNYLEGINEKSN